MPTSSAIFDPTADLRWVEKGELQILTVAGLAGRVRKRPSAKAEASDARISSSHRPLGRQHRFIKVRCQLRRAISPTIWCDETRRRLEDRLEILPLRSGRVRLQIPVDAFSTAVSPRNLAPNSWCAY